MESLSSDLPDPVDFIALARQGQEVVKGLRSQQSFLGRMWSSVPGAGLDDHLSRLAHLETKLGIESAKLGTKDPSSKSYSQHRRKEIKLRRKIIEQKMKVVQDIGALINKNLIEGITPETLASLQSSLGAEISAVRKEGYQFAAQEEIQRIFRRLGKEKTLVTSQRVGGLDLGFTIAGGVSSVERRQYEIEALEEELVEIENKLQEGELTPQQREALQLVRLACLEESIHLQLEARSQLLDTIVKLEFANDQNPKLPPLRAERKRLDKAIKTNIQRIQPLVLQQDQARARRNAEAAIKHKEQDSWFFEASRERDPYTEIRSELPKSEQMAMRLQAGDAYLHTLRTALDSEDAKLSGSHRQRVEDHYFTALHEKVFHTYEFFTQCGDEKISLQQSGDELDTEEERADVAQELQQIAELKRSFKSGYQRDMDQLVRCAENYYLQRSEQRVKEFFGKGKTAQPAGVAEPIQVGGRYISKEQRVDLELEELNAILNKLEEALENGTSPSGEQLSTTKLKQTRRFYRSVMEQRIALADMAEKEFRQIHADNERRGPVPEKQAQLSRAIEEYAKIQLAEAQNLAQLEAGRSDYLARKRTAQQTEAGTGLGEIRQRLLGGTPKAATRQEVWKKEEWGKILLQDDKETGLVSALKDTASRLVRSDFVQSVDAKRAVIRATESELKVLEKQRKEIKKELKRGVPSPEREDVFNQNLGSIDQTIKQKNDNLMQARISEQATFIQRIVDKTGDYAYSRNQKEKQLGELRTKIETWDKKALQVQEVINQLELGKEVEIGGVNYPEIGEALEMTEGDPLVRLDRMHALLGEYKASLVEQKQRARTLGVEIDTLTRDLAVLDQAYQVKIRDYAALSPPKRGFMEMIKQGVSDEAARFLSGGLYGMPVYVRPEEFRTKHAFAEKGYCLAAGIEEWKKWEGDDLTSMIQTQVYAFCDWADQNPREASRMAVDISLAINLIQDKPLQQTLLDAVNAKVYTDAVLGSLGREYEVHEVKPEHFRFMALAELARYGPQMNAGVRAGAAAASSLIEGRIGGALVAAAGTYAVESYKGEAVQRFVNSLDTHQAQAAKAALQALRGDDMQTILSAQRDVEIARIAGNARRGVRSPGKALRSFGRRFAEPFRSIGKSRSWPERIVRTLTVVVPPLAGVGAAIGIVGQAAAGTIGVPLAIGTGFLSIFAGAFFLVPLVYRLTNLAFPDTHLQIKQEHAERVAERDFAPQLHEQSLVFLQDLKNKQAIPSAEEGIVSQPLLQTEVNWAASENDPGPKVKQELIAALEEAKEQKMVDIRSISSNPEYAQLEPKDCARIFKDTLKEYNLANRLTTLVDEGQFEVAEIDGELESRQQVLRQIENRVLQELTDGWLKDNIDISVKQEFVNRYNSYESPAQFRVDQERFMQVKRQGEADAKKRLRERIVDGHPQRDTMSVEEKNRLKKQVDEAVIPAGSAFTSRAAGW